MRIWSLAAGLLIVFTFFMLATAVQAAPTPVSVEKRFTGDKVTIDDFQGTLTIVAVPNRTDILVKASAKPDDLKRLDIRQDGSGVLVRLERNNEGVYWPWSTLNWDRNRDTDFVVAIEVPLGTAFDLDDVGGRISASDLDAPLTFGGVGGGTARFGRVTRARLSVAGSMEVLLGDVREDTSLELAGSGSIKMGRTQALRVEVAGSGEVDVAAVNGKVDIELAGSGDVTIRGGRADPFAVEIAGSSDVTFDGEAVNPDITIAGSGDVSVGSMSGTLKQSIVGSGDFVIKGKPAAASPGALPSVPPISPAPPPPPPAPPATKTF